jgi:hypothetical protein
MRNSDERLTWNIVRNYWRRCAIIRLLNDITVGIVTIHRATDNDTTARPTTVVGAVPIDVAALVVGKHTRAFAFARMQ